MIVFVEDQGAKWWDYARATLVFSLLVIFFFISIGYLDTYVYVGTDAVKSEYSQETALKQHLEDCRQLKPETWDALSDQEKVNLLHAICDYESQYVLGCKRVKVLVGMTGGERVLGEYKNPTRSFMIDTDHLRNDYVEDVVDTMLHELRHAYQYDLAEAYAVLEPHLEEEQKNLLHLRQAYAFLENFENYYDNGNDGFDKYFTQTVEVDCRTWAAERIDQFYIKFIEFE